MSRSPAYRDRVVSLRSTEHGGHSSSRGLGYPAATQFCERGYGAGTHHQAQAA